MWASTAALITVMAGSITAIRVNSEPYSPTSRVGTHGMEDEHYNFLTKGMFSWK